MDESNEELELRGQTDITIEYNTGSIDVTYTDIFGREHTMEGRSVYNIFEELELRLRLDEMANDSFVPLSEEKDKTPTQTTSAKLRDNFEERFTKSIEYLQKHPAIVSVNGSRQGREIWAESILTQDPVEFDTFERVFGLERFGSFLRYNDKKDRIVKDITWDVNELILEIGEQNYDKMISELDEELPDYAETIDELIQEHSE